MISGLWQPATIQRFVTLLEPNRAVKALILVGSNANGLADLWSDSDLVCVVDDNALDQFFPHVQWLDAVGEVLGFEQSASEFKAVTRICFADFRRVDLIFQCEYIFEQTDAWNYPAQDTRVLFSRSAFVDAALAANRFTPRPPRAG